MLNKSIHRRTFLRMLAGTIAAGYAGRGAYASQDLLSPSTGISLNGPLSYEIFAALLGESFMLSKLTGKNRRITRLKLVEANPVFLSPENDQFHLVFQAFKTDVTINGTYRIRHPSAGEMQIFLQPMGSDMPGNYCRADFNLLV